jgi:hypothetical protein
MPDTLEPEGFDPERHIIGEQAFIETRDLVIRAAATLTGDTQVAQQRTTLLTMIAAIAVAAAPLRYRVPGMLALVLLITDLRRRR